jgi:tRNA (guanine9-N1)-methyltransferase
MTDQDYFEAFPDTPKSKFVYLSADSPNMLESFETDNIYILGGIVDRNRFPSLCYNKAVEQGISTAQLPIGKYVNLSTRRILTVNQGTFVF